MAEHNEISYSTADGNDLPAHEDMYQFFLRLMTWGTGIVIAILILMAIFLV